MPRHQHKNIFNNNSQDKILLNEVNNLGTWTGTSEASFSNKAQGTEIETEEWIPQLKKILI